MTHLPIELAEQVEAALEAVRNHPEHVLLPVHRLAVYGIIERLPIPLDYYTRVWLDIVTVQRIVHIWKPIEELKDTFPEYIDLPGRMLSLVERLLGANDKKRPLKKGELWAGVSDSDRESCREWQEWSYTDWGFWQGTKYYLSSCVFEAILRTIHSVLGREDLKEESIKSNTTDDDIPSYSNDAALWTSIAYAEGVWQPKDETERDGTWDLSAPEARSKRQEFWSWWLNEAIAMAWEKAKEGIGSAA